jgi:hypothetical protein
MTAHRMKKLAILIVTVMSSMQIYANNAPGTLGNGEPPAMQGGNNGMQPPPQSGGNGMRPPPPRDGENGMQPPPPPQGNNNGMQPPPPRQNSSNDMQPPPSSPQNVSHQIPNGAQTQPLQRPGNDKSGKNQAQHQNGSNAPGSSDIDIAPENMSN